MRTITRTEADIEKTAANYSAVDLANEALASIEPLATIAKFCTLVESGENPPKWMMRFLSNGFAEFLGNGGSKSMESCFRIKPAQFKARQPDNKPEIMESYAMIRYLFGLTHDKTAEIIKQWYSYPADANTLKQEFQRNWQKYTYGDDWAFGMDEQMAISARATIFLEDLKANHPAVFQKLKQCKGLFKRNKKHPAF